MRLALVIFFALLILLATHASAEESQVTLTPDGSRLTISDLRRNALPAIELTSVDCIPIVWFHRGIKQAELPMVLMPGVEDPVIVTLLKQPRSIVVRHQNVPQVKVDPEAYAKLSDWRPTSSPADRRTTMLLAVAMGTTVLLASLARRGAALAVGAVAITWCVGLAIASTDRKTLIERDENSTRWFLAVEPQVVRVPIASRESVVPVVESMAHLKAVAPRIVVDGSDATLEFDLPKNAKVGVVRLPR